MTELINESVTEVFVEQPLALPCSDNSSSSVWCRRLVCGDLSSTLNMIFTLLFVLVFTLNLISQKISTQTIPLAFRKNNSLKGG